MLSLNTNELQKIGIMHKLESYEDIGEIIDNFFSIVNVDDANDDEKFLFNKYIDILHILANALDNRSIYSETNFANQKVALYQIRRKTDANIYLIYPWIEILKTVQFYFNDEQNNNHWKDYLYWFDIHQKDRTGDVEYLSHEDLYALISYLQLYGVIDDSVILDINKKVEIDIYTNMIGHMNFHGTWANQNDQRPDISSVINPLSVPNWYLIDSIYNTCKGEDIGSLNCNETLLDLLDLLDINRMSTNWCDGHNAMLVNSIKYVYESYHQLFYKVIQSKYRIKNLIVITKDLLRIWNNYQTNIMLIAIAKILYCIHRLIITSSEDTGELLKIRKYLKNKIDSSECYDGNLYINNVTPIILADDVQKLFERKYCKLNVDNGVDILRKTTRSMQSKYSDSMLGNKCSEDGVVEVTSLMNALTEMFEVRRDGTIKVTTKDRSTFMNEYATNHRLLKYNEQRGDYEGMKYNLVYHMILIENIEKNVIYNNRISKNSDVYKDAEKARNFAKNDIAIYLPKLQEADESFDLNAFYKQVKADKETITIDGPATVSGAKEIFKSILL